MEGRLYDIVMSEKVANDYEVQAYRVFHYGQQNKSYIQLDTAYNTHKAKIYCWITDRSTDLSNSGTYGITFVPGNSAYDFSDCTSGVEDTDTYEGGLGFPVWRLNVKKVKVKKPKDACIEYSSALWNDTGKLDGYKVKKHYWYIWKYQVKPASDAARQEAYGKGCDEVGRYWKQGFGYERKRRDYVPSADVYPSGSDYIKDSNRYTGILYTTGTLPYENNIYL